MKFMLKSGTHYEPVARKNKTKRGKKGPSMKRYVAGDVIESDKPLDKKFRNKFRRLYEDELDEKARRIETQDDTAAEVGEDLDDEEGTQLKIVKVKKGKYDVVNTETDERMNDEYLTKKEAEEMVEGLASADEDEDDDEDVWTPNNEIDEDDLPEKKEKSKGKGKKGKSKRTK